MSMVAMTEGTPRSSDGLQMEWVAAPFGPLFPGLPGGLALTLTLDGDTVAESVVSSAVGMPRFEGMSGSAETFAGWLASLDPFSPVAYRALALRAFEDAAGIAPDERTTLARIGAMERERAASHLGWLAGFGYLTGHARLAERAGKLQLALLRAGGSGESDRLRASGASEISRLKIEVDKLVENLRRNPLLTRRLKGVGEIPGDAEASGSVARARGASADARADDEGYRSLGFEAVVRGGGDALSRMRVRLAEVSHSLDLILAAGSISVPSDSFDYGLSGKGSATVETPRGKASLRLSLRGRGVSGLELHTPSTRHIELVESVAKERELADALVGVASLDISPWEVLH
ncbi:MAG: NADH-quinone oxidoreductase subunit D [Rubrobacter sp.]|nr:NADH-quinone oxidoreductase subunit D [Rubrobacter sp.]